VLSDYFSFTLAEIALWRE